MAKKPVQKTVIRNGQPHVQTYWEDDQKGYYDEKGNYQPSLLAGLAPTLNVPQRSSRQQQQVDPVLEAEWAENMEHDFSADDVDAAIAAGLSVNAAIELKSTLHEWTSLGEHIYDHELDQQPRPKGGWQDDGPRPGQKRGWEMAEVPLETAVEFIDAGFPTPWSGIPDLIEAGVPLERIKEWDQDNPTPGKYSGSNLRLHYLELTSDMSLEETKKYRKAFFGERADQPRLERRHIDYFNENIPAAEAARWEKVISSDIPVEQVVKLREAGWSPTSIKPVIKKVRGWTGKNAKLDRTLATQIIQGTEALGSSKLFGEWCGVFSTSPAVLAGDSTLITDRDAEQVHSIEQFKERLATETGLALKPEHNGHLVELLPLQREAFAELVKETGMNSESAGITDEIRAMDIAKTVASAENFDLLRNHGFEFGDSNEEHLVLVPSIERFGYETFNAAQADEGMRNKWMKEMAFHLYSDQRRTKEQKERFTADDTVSVRQLKDLLMEDPDISDVKLEGLLVAGVAKPVSEGWL